MSSPSFTNLAALAGAPAAPANDGKLLCRVSVPKRNLTKTVRLNLVRERVENDEKQNGEGLRIEGDGRGREERDAREGAARGRDARGTREREQRRGRRGRRREREKGLSEERGSVDADGMDAWNGHCSAHRATQAKQTRQHLLFTLSSQPLSPSFLLYPRASVIPSPFAHSSVPSSLS